jgi:hypothetical protein
MGVTIQFESHRVELAVVYEMEHDPDVLEYYDQAPSTLLDYESATASAQARVLVEPLTDERQKGIEHRGAQLLGALEALHFDRRRTVSGWMLSASAIVRIFFQCLA